MLPIEKTMQPAPIKEYGARVQVTKVYTILRRYPGDGREGFSMEWTRVDGADRGSIRLYALSTCGWCAKTKQLLKDLGVAFQYVYVDLLPPGELQQALTEVERYNPQGSFPTIVINDSMTIVGFQEGKIREAVRG